MTQAPPGWYQDPGAPPGAPPHIRYWDGSTWTHHVQPAYGGPPRPTGPTTVDGQRLSGWWWRVLAQVLDGIFLGILSNLLTLPVQADVQRRMQVLSEEYLRTGPDQTPDFAAFWDAIAEVYRDHVVGLLVIPVLVVLAYNAFFLRGRGATLGKLICGLRVRLRERPGTLPWSTIAVRLLVQNVLPSALVVLGFMSGSIPVLVVCYLGFFGFYALDALWATWDKNRQTIHDLAARTQVVRIR
jgi:uncharacterized RDD family membrane protein YckC